MEALVRSMTGGHPARPVVVLSNLPEAGGLDKARAAGIATSIVDHRGFQDRAAFEAVLLREIKLFEPDIICLAGFMRVLSAEFVTHFSGQMLNIHPSLLPKYTGLNTHCRAIEAGDAEAGCTVHEVTAELDSGPILGQARVPILPGDTPGDLAARVLEQEHILYPAVLERFSCGNLAPLFLSA